MRFLFNLVSGLIQVAIISALVFAAFLAVVFVLFLQADIDVTRL